MSAIEQIEVLTDPAPRWLRVSAAVKYSGISRSLLYELLQSGKIESRVLRKRGALRGIRLVSVASIDTFIEGLPDGRSEP